jgi:ribosomal protein S18 acetylase RimI-like enzyme
MTGQGLVGYLDGEDWRATKVAAELLGQSVPDSGVGLVAYHASGYPRFLRAVLTPASEARTVLLRTVVLAGELVAVADWRILESELFLNGLAVRQEFRGHGYGRQLLLDGIATAQDLGVSALGLHVACDNEPASALYRSIGFHDAGAASWVDVTNCAGAPRDSRVRFVDWPLFEAHRVAYGFGDLTVRLGTGRVARIRMIGDTMRINWDQQVDLPVAQLRAMLDASRVYVVSKSGVSPVQPPFAQFIRMKRLTSKGGDT